MLDSRMFNAAIRTAAGRWWFTLGLVALYIAVFELWRALPRLLFATGFIGLALGILGTWQARRSAYFRNRWDALFHLCVLLDILLEMALIKDHNHAGFYLCAVAFLAVTAIYHAVDRTPHLAKTLAIRNF